MSHPTTINDDGYVGESDPEVDDPPLPLGAPHQLLVGVVPEVGTLHDPPHPSSQRDRLALLPDHADQAAILKKLSGCLRVVAVVEVDARPIWQPSEGLDDSV